MIVAIYIRVSTLDQAREGYSLAAQQHTLENWCETHSHTVFEVYEDAGISGKDIKHRPAMLEMLNDIRCGKIDIVLVWALSRLTRSVADLYNTWELLQKKHCDLISYTEAFDTSTPMGRAMMGMLGVFAQMEREMTAERVSLAMRERAYKGGRTCSNVLGYDTTPGGLVKNKREALIVQNIYDTYEKTGSLTATAQWCRDHNITGKRGRIMDAWKIRVILTRPIYAGYYSYKELRIRSDVEPIISVERYNNVAKMINSSSIGRHTKDKIQLLS